MKLRPIARVFAADGKVRRSSRRVTSSIERAGRFFTTRLGLIERQSAIRALATPIIKVWDDVLCLPVIGTVDSARTADVLKFATAGTMDHVEIETSLEKGTRIVARKRR